LSEQRTLIGCAPSSGNDPLAEAHRAFERAVYGVNQLALNLRENRKFSVRR
jgi:hypothetical protein